MRDPALAVKRGLMRRPFGMALAKAPTPMFSASKFLIAVCRR
jgi:hypothetical protein